MRLPIRAATAAIAVSMLAAACGASATPAPTPAPVPPAATTAPNAAPTAVATSVATPAPTAAAAATDTPAPSQTPALATDAPVPTDAAVPTDTPAADTPAPTDNSTPGPVMSLAPGQASDLEALLPSSIKGVQLTKKSFDGSKALTSINLGGKGMTAFMSARGKTSRDLRAATAESPNVGSTAGGVLIAAIQIKGVAATDMIAEILKEMTSSSGKFTQQTVGGKSVERLSQGTGTASSAIDLYAKDDIVFEVVLFGDITGEADILSSLP